MVELVRDGLRRTHDPAMLNASIAMLPMLTRTDAIEHVNERVARLEAELVEQAKWWEDQLKPLRRLRQNLHNATVTPEDLRTVAAGFGRMATEAYRLLMEVLGTAATLRADSPGALLRGRIERMHRSCLILTFGGGTNEIQRDIISMIGLTMPRPPR